MSLSREPLVAADLVDDLIHRYDAPRDLSDDFEPHGYCPPANGLIDVLEQQVSVPFFFLKIKNHQFLLLTLFLIISSSSLLPYPSPLSP
jgi:hypothetical protein